MIKSIKYISLALAVTTLGTMTSCSDFLDEENKVGNTAEFTYDTKSGIEGLMGSAYTYARLWYGREGGTGLTDGGTDEFYYGYDNKQKSMLKYDITAVSMDNNTADNPCLDQYWEAYFSVVNVVNTALKYIDSNSNITDNEKTQYNGEAYFLRAFYYWHMVNLWGAVHYRTEPVSNPISSETRDAEEIVYGKMLADLDKSIEYLSKSSNTKASGHVTLAAAYAFKARVLLYAASWLNGQLGKQVAGNDDYSSMSKSDLYNAAKSAAETAISQSGCSFYANYADCWHQNNEFVGTNKEVIWGVVFSSNLAENVPPYRYKTDSDGEQLEYNTIIGRCSSTHRENGSGSVNNLMFVGKWDNAGSDLQDVMMRITTNPNMTNTYTGVTVDVSKTYSQYSRGFTRYVPSIYLLELFDKVKDTDQRYDVTIRDHYDIAPGMEGGSKFYRMMNDTAIYFSPFDGNSPEGIAQQKHAKYRYRIHFRSGGALPIYKASDGSSVVTAKNAVPTETAPELELNPYANDDLATAKAESGDENYKMVNLNILKKAYNSVNYGGWQSYPAIKKFEDQNETTTPDVSTRDVPVLRLSEMYLIIAECLLQTGDASGALAKINELRDARAISGKDNQVKGTCDMNTILDERALELVGEQQRWFDLKRTGKLIERVQAYNAQAAANIKSYHLLRPIPQAQIDAITNFSVVPGEGFWQNPGY